MMIAKDQDHYMRFIHKSKKFVDIQTSRARDQKENTWSNKYVQDCVITIFFQENYSYVFQQVSPSLGAEGMIVTRERIHNFDSQTFAYKFKF